MFAMDYLMPCRLVVSEKSGMYIIISTHDKHVTHYTHTYFFFLSLSLFLSNRVFVHLHQRVNVDVLYNDV